MRSGPWRLKPGKHWLCDRCFDNVIGSRWPIWLQEAMCHLRFHDRGRDMNRCDSATKADERAVDDGLSDGSPSTEPDPIVAERYPQR